MKQISKNMIIPIILYAFFILKVVCRHVCIEPFDVYV